MFFDTLLDTLLFLAQATPPPAGPRPSMWNMLLPFICVGVIFYFLIIRPQNRKQKEHELLVKNVKTGDKIITSGGIHGLISNVKDTTVTLKVADNVKIEIERSSIATVSKATA